MLTDTRTAALPAEQPSSSFHMAMRILPAQQRAALARWQHPRAAVRLGKFMRIGIMLRHTMG